MESDLTGGWSVVLQPNARVRRIRAELPRFLKQLELAGVPSVWVGSWPRGEIEEAALRLRMSNAFQSDTSDPGSIFPTIQLPVGKSGGAVASTGDALAEWLSVWIQQPEQAHNLEKLRRSEADERHLVVILPGFADASFAVTDLLMRDRAPLPTIPPTLPNELTHVWLMSTWNSGDGIRWSSDLGWQRFDKQVQHT